MVMLPGATDPYPARGADEGGGTGGVGDGVVGLVERDDPGTPVNILVIRIAASFDSPPV